MQAGHCAHPRQVWQVGDCRRYWNGVELNGAAGVGAEPHVIAGGEAAIAAAVGADLPMAVALGIKSAAEGVIKQEGCHAGLLKADQFAGIGLGIGIGINPEPQTSPFRITGRNLIVKVAIEAAQGFEAIGGSLVVRQAGVVAEQFCSARDAAIAIKIPHQQSISLTYPTAAFREAVVVMVEVDSASAERPCGDTVAIEVEH